MSTVFDDSSTAANTSKIPSQGEIVRVRQRHYLVEDVIPPRRKADSTIVALSCIEDDAQGQPLEVLWERELDAEPFRGEQWAGLAKNGFDDPDLFSSYFNTLKWNCVTATDPNLFQSPFRAGIKLEAYQLEPLRKALRLPRVNLFIADDVGLGKTIEAGLIARELLLRKRVRDIVVSAPPSMLLQWKDELESRFGLTFEILDKDYVKRVRQERGFSVNPWSTHSRFLISHRLLIDEHYGAPLRDWLGTFRPGSLLVLDEAHHAAPASGQRYAIDSKITRAVEDFAKRFEHRLFLSATPHNGHSNSFSRLLELLDPQRFCRGVAVEPAHRDEVVVRRLKEDIRAVGIEGFPQREVIQVDIDGLPADAPELTLMALLNQYRELRERRMQGQNKRQQAAAGLLITGLQQRLLSSIEAFARTLSVHKRTVQRQWEATQKTKGSTSTIRATTLDLLSDSVDYDNDRANLSEEELQAEEDAQFELASAASAIAADDTDASENWQTEQQLLDKMTTIANASRGQADARVRELFKWIDTNMCPGLLDKSASAKPAWNETRLLIFTEYEDTKRYLVQQLQAAIAKTDQASVRIEVFHGPTPPEKREEIKRAFNAPPQKHPVRILVATDAAREGLNLQAHCWNLFHFDVPWNPSRMEQRNGRIDRKLQPKDKVRCHYFYYQQRPEDRILKVLVRKTQTIREELGSLSQVIDARLAATMKRGIRHDQIAEMESTISSADLDPVQRKAIESELEAARERQDALRHQINHLRTLASASQESIGLNEELFQKAISSSLRLLNAPELTPVSDSVKHRVPRLTFPALDQRHGADSTWANTMDSLRVPRERGQKPWDWRRESPVRPVVFQDPGEVTDEVVHLFLEHRIVQRLLGRFISQGFVYDDLSRACLAQTRDAIPRVLLTGRLALYGPGAARLHEELIVVSARWTEPSIRQGTLQLNSDAEHQKTLTLLDDALAESGHPINSLAAKQLKESATADIQQLQPLLMERGLALQQLAAEKLQSRAEEEAAAMAGILRTQRGHIMAEIKKHQDKYSDPKQLKFDFGDDEDELRQLESNKRYWAKRLEMLDGELKTEPKRIRELYEIKATRLEPIGLIYLWPATG
ncbi:MAG: DISARM system SNF2-like helicase DrmD [Planctomyces sp.]